MEQESEWTSVPTFDTAVPLAPARGKLNQPKRYIAGQPARHVSAGEGQNTRWQALSRLACTTLVFTAGAVSAGLAVWLRLMRLIGEQQDHIDLLRREVDGLMNAPLLGSGGAGAAYLQELYCKRTRHWAPPAGTAAAATPPAESRFSGCARACQAQQRPQPQQDFRRRWAYVTMAHCEPDKPQAVQHMWGAVAIASALQRLGSKFPLLLLTNMTAFPDGTSVAKALRSFNVLIQPIYRVDMPHKHRKNLMYQKWMVAFWKLQIWKLTEWEKLIWLDADSFIYRSLDWLFERPWMWAQRDDWFCRLNVSKVCSGIMLVYPNASDFRGLLEHAQDMHNMRDGDQQLISSYFATKRRLAVNLLSDVEAAFGQCLGKAPGPYINKDGSQVAGVWNVPSFVHKSGGWGNTNSNEYSNVCFMPNISMQLYSVGDATLNVCQYHPLGAYWRTLFCEAIALMGVRTLEVNAFCNDECWYRGRPRNDWESTGGLRAGDWRLCGEVNATLSYADYYARRAGLPGAGRSPHGPRRLLSRR